ncbi:hypothetical protein L5515_016591 [Caenorhabditis briggsae]|uniref:Uncharacterized protein n=2 Tax=Caenorhabditis briggsae TaxID=6238 RepID=A0AAE9FD98_CAEBR|nr:hypothetical protein L5515_016591 [Caenorhabditis briggsae]
MDIPLDSPKWRKDLHKVREELFVQRFRKLDPHDTWTLEEVANFANIILEIFKHSEDLEDNDITAAIYIVDNPFIHFRNPEKPYELLFNWTSREWWRNLENAPELSNKLLEKSMDLITLNVLLAITRDIFSAIPRLELDEIVKFANEFIRLTFQKVSAVIPKEEIKEMMKKLKDRTEWYIPCSEMYMDLWRMCWHKIHDNYRTPDVLISGVSVPIPDSMGVDAYFLEFLNQTFFVKYHYIELTIEEKVSLLKFLTSLNFHEINYYFVARGGKQVMENLYKHLLQVDSQSNNDDFLRELRNFVVKASAYVIEIQGENLRNLLENVADSLYDGIEQSPNYRKILLQMHLASRGAISLGDRKRSLKGNVRQIGSKRGFDILTTIAEIQDQDPHTGHNEIDLESLMSYDESPAVFDPRQQGSIRKWLAMAEDYGLNTGNPEVEQHLYLHYQDLAFAGTKWTHDTFPLFFHLLAATARSLIGKHYGRLCLKDPQQSLFDPEHGLLIFDYIFEYSLQFILAILHDKSTVLQTLLGSENAEKLCAIHDDWKEWTFSPITKLTKSEIKIIVESKGTIVEDYISGKNTKLEDFVDPLVDMFTTAIEMYDFPKSYIEFRYRSFQKDCYTIAIRPLLLIMPLKGLKIIVANSRGALRMTLGDSGEAAKQDYQKDWQRVRDSFSGDFSREYFSKFPQTIVEFYSITPKTWLTRTWIEDEKNVAAVVNFHKLYDYPEVLDYLVIRHYFQQFDAGNWTIDDWARAKRTEIKSVLIGKPVDFHL